MENTQRYLEVQVIQPQFPREISKMGFMHQIIDNGHLWMAMLQQRNELAHIYNQAVSDRAVKRIKYSCYPALQQLYSYFKSKVR